MNRASCQRLIDDVCSDIADTLRADDVPRSVCIWLRVRLSGVVDTCTALHDGLRTGRADAALSSLDEREDEAMRLQKEDE